MLVQLLDPDPILRDDPVRPKISPKRRVQGKNRSVYAWVEDKQICAIVCVTHEALIPTTEKELFKTDWEWPSKAVLYSVWSYKKGSASKLVRALVKKIQKRSGWRIVTMSPKTDMARDFHLRNGASLLQENETTVNYEY
jgi:hypothetical protein